MFGWKKKKKQDGADGKQPKQKADEALAAGMGETLVPDPGDVPSATDDDFLQSPDEEVSDSDVRLRRRHKRRSGAGGR
ncbi:MAG: hypothetical protein R3C19_10905 [Planctomycetaceae bacterium]